MLESMSALAITTIEEAFFHDIPVVRKPLNQGTPPEGTEDFGTADTMPLTQVTTNDFSAESKAPFQSEGLYRWFRDWGLNE
jgi:hypothetical protein